MTRQELLQRISIDPNACFGKPCIRGLRIWLSLVLDLLASRPSVQSILDDCLGLVTAAILDDLIA